MEKWIKLYDNVEIQAESTEINSEKDIKIPEGYRLPTFAEIALAMEKKIILFDDTWVEYCYYQNETRAVWLSSNAVRFNLGYNFNPISDGGRARRVRFCRDLNSEKVE